MLKRIFGITISVCLMVVGAFTGFAIWHSSSTQPTFETDGYVLLGDGLEAKQLSFTAAARYQVSGTGVVKFEDSTGEKVTVQKESFVHFGDGGIMALSDGILLDFNDLSDNFINNYFITAGLTIQSAGTGYTAETTVGTIAFGDHLWKLSNQKYLIRSSHLTVCYSEEEQREVEDYVQIHITDDGIAQILTPENMWMTISEECYIETASGVRIYPMTQIVTDDAYKMSLAKLSVAADDSIILTEDETRRQIVPELHIEAVDGEDGLDGEEGSAGIQGITGEDGIDGEDGVSGSKGQTGEKGKSGNDGKDGTAGRRGSSGSDGADGSNGQGGLTGNPGQTGNNAVVDSSTNTALPTMTFEDWNVTATSLSGMIAINDPNGFLLETDGDHDHAATVKIYNQETGEEILCYEMSDGYAEFLTSQEAIEGKFEGIYNSEQVYFSTKNDPLKPDTRYRISVYAYYIVNETIYSREFISRSFYTDSTGIHLSAKAVDDHSITLNVSAAEAYRDSISLAEVYLLTPSQNDAFSLTSNGNYNYKFKLDYAAGTATLYQAGTLDPNTTITFDKASHDLVFQGIYDTDTEPSVYTGLPSNTKYIARVRVVSNSGMDALTRQELEVSTLKKTPTWDGTPRATYNRVTGGFEVWRPSVTDPDGGAVNYTYTAYTADDEGDFTIAYQTRTLTPGESEPAVFFLTSGVDYRFGVTLQFDDNEKTVRYDLGMSNVIKAEGATLPSVTLNMAGQITEYDSMSGTVRINLTDNRQSLTVNATRPLELNIYSDQLYNQTITIKGNDTVTGADSSGATIYTATYSGDQTNTPSVNLSLSHLYKNSNYTITVVGYLDVGDGNGAVKRAIGTVSFRTYDTVPLTAVMDRSEGETAISMRLRLTADDATIQNASARNAYAMEQLRSGQVELQLYAGTGYGATLLATTNINEDGQLDKVFGTDGLEVTETMFGSPTLNPSADYTLRVARVVDGTYDMDMGYVNEFSAINNASAIIVAEATPPDLLLNPAKGVTADPIYKKDAAKFGATEYAAMENMPDDTIVGYTVQANYDNAQRLGLNVTYYAMEYGAFYRAVINSSAADPLNPEGEGGIPKLMEVTLPVSSESDNVPKVAFLFGGEKSTESVGQYSGYYVYRTGVANPVSNGDDTHLAEGMDRGYRYVFAYTVEYSRTGETDSTGIYPYGHAAYNQYKEQFGVGQEYGKTLGKGNVYILNSGMCEAPRVMPHFYTYLDHVVDTNVLTGGIGAVSSGTAVVHYTWTNDIDRTISTSSGTKTQIHWETPQQGYADIDGTTVTGASTGMSGDGNAANWYSVNIPYTVDPSELSNLIRPIVQIDQYVLDYENMLYALRLGTAYAEEDDAIYLCRMPMDWAWGKYFEGAANRVYFDFEVNETKNYIQFDLSTEPGSELHTLLASRAYALKVTIAAGRNNQKIFYLPLENALGGGIYARLATGLLGSDFVDETFTIREATVLYDTGDQGWGLIGGRDTFVGIQYAGTINTPRLGDYNVTDGKGNSTSSYSPKNGLIKVMTDNALPVIRQNALVDPEENSSAINQIHFQTHYAADPSGSFSRYLRPTHGGVDQSISPTSMTGNFLTVKDVGEYRLTLQRSEGTIEKIIPTVIFPYEIYRPGTMQITLNKFSISGADQADDRKVIVCLFNNAEDIDAGVPLQRKEFALNDSSEWIPPTEEEIAVGAMTGVFDGGDEDNLEANRNYVLAFYMTIDGEEVLLMQMDGTSNAVYTVKTSDEIDITSTMSIVQYINQSYFDKSLQLDFKLSRSWGVKMRYDIFTTAPDAETVWGTDDAAVPYLSYEDMKTNGMLTEPTALNPTGNILTINMTPSTNREKLTPGRTYWLRVTAMEESSGGNVAVGSAKFGAAIPPIGNYGALVYVKNATHEKIEYEVTINDAQFSFMGNNSYLNGAGLYTVRFTYTNDEGKECRIVTSYDNQVFSASEAKKPFELSTNTVDASWASANYFSIGSDTEYKLHVYAVVDPQHTGVSYPTETGGDGWSWTKFFSNIANRVGAWFTDFVNSFWQDGNYQNDDAMDAVEAKFHVAEKVQKTTIRDGVLLNKEKAAVGRMSETQLRLILPESFGLVDFGNNPSGDQVYKKIVWDVDGSTLSGTAVHYNGISLASEGALMIQQPLASSKVNYEYYYDIPQNIANGTYLITIQLYKNANELQHETLSFNFYG